MQMERNVKKQVKIVKMRHSNAYRLDKIGEGYIQYIYEEQLIW